MISSFQRNCIASELTVYIWLLWFTVEKQKTKEILESFWLHVMKNIGKWQIFNIQVSFNVSVTGISKSNLN